MAPSHVDLSVLWVPIMPETSKLGEQMEKAGKDATESFDKGSAGIGDKVAESVSKTKHKITDIFHRSGKDASDAMSDGVKENSKKVEDALEESGKKAGGKFGNVIKDALPDAFSKGGLKLDGLAERLGTEVGKKLGGGIGDQLQKLDGYAKTVGLDISGWTKPINDAATPFSTLQKDAEGFASQITGVTGNFEKMPGKIGKVASAISDLAIPLSMVEQGLEKINDLFDKAGGKRKWDDVVNPSDPNAGQGFWDKFGRVFQSWVPGGTFDKGPGPAPPPPGGFWGYGGSNPSSLAPLFPGVPAGQPPSPLHGPPPIGGWFGGKGHGASAPSSFTAMPPPVPGRDVGSDKGLTPTSQSVKKVVSSLFPQISDIGGWRPPDGYNEHSSGQALDVMIPNPTSPQGKALGDQISQYVLAHAKELGVDYTIWQHGQHNPDGSFQMYPDRGGPTQNHMDHVHIHTTRGGGDGTSPSDMLASGTGGGSGSARGSITAPIGNQHDPIYTTSVSPDGSPSGGSGGDAASQQLGSGFLDGIMQSVGLDGSVFKTFGGASNPMDFGATKMGMGLLNWGMGLAQQKGGARGMPGMGSSLAAGLQESPTRGSGGYTAPNVTNHVDNSMTVNGPTDVPSLKGYQNSSDRAPGLMANLPGQ